MASTDEAATVVRFATRHKIPFSVRGGGYSTSGASTARGGIVLDLSNLRNVHVDPVSRVVTAQGGALWGDIDVAASQYGLALVGSTLNHIGAAGATLGGGYGWLTGQYGLAIDNLLWARIILADGSIVTASDGEHPDLFWAIRGAGQSFGVAVELAFRAHIQDHPVFAGTLLFSPDVLPAIVDFANQFETLTDGKQGLWVGFTMLPTMAHCSILVVVFYNGTQAAAEEFFSPLFSLGPMANATQMLPYDGLNAILNGMDTLGHRGSLTRYDITLPADHIMGPRKSLRGSNITLPLDVDFVQSIYNKFDGILTECPQARNSRLIIELLPNTQVKNIPNDATAFASRGPYYNVSSIFRWHEAHMDERIQSLQADLMSDIGTRGGIARKPNYNVSELGTGLYANYAGTLAGLMSLMNIKSISYEGEIAKEIIGHDSPLEAIFGDNLPRLRELKKKYDPHNTFRRWHHMLEKSPCSTTEGSRKTLP